MRSIFRVVSAWVEGFIQKDYFSKASSLTFYSLLSIVPLLAIAFGIAKGFGFENNLEEEILAHFQEQKELANLLIKFAYSWLSHAKGGLIAGIGIVFLFWSVITLLSNIENALNEIWHVKEARSLPRRFSDYLAMMLILPIVFFISSSLTVFISTQVSESARTNGWMHAMSPYYFHLLRLSPFLLSWILFSFLYTFVPDTKVSFSTGIITGVLAGTTFQIWQWLYINFQTSISSYGAIYGSFAALPLFLLWLQYSWLIVLVGAEIGFHIENALSLPQTKLGPTRNVSAKVIGLTITYQCVHAFSRGEPPLTDRHLVQLTGTPLNDVKTLLDILQKSAILTQTKKGFLPARDIHTMTIKDVVDAINTNFCFEVPIQETLEVKNIQAHLNRLEEATASAEANIPLYKV
jgi:membrane protein